MPQLRNAAKLFLRQRPERRLPQDVASAAWFVCHGGDSIWQPALVRVWPSATEIANNRP
jgi:hypothetical protein